MGNLLAIITEKTSPVPSENREAVNERRPAYPESRSSMGGDDPMGPLFNISPHLYNVADSSWATSPRTERVPAPLGSLDWGGPRLGTRALTTFSHAHHIRCSGRMRFGLILIAGPLVRENRTSPSNAARPSWASRRLMYAITFGWAETR